MAASIGDSVGQPRLGSESLGRLGVNGGRGSIRRLVYRCDRIASLVAWAATRKWQNERTLAEFATANLRPADTRDMGGKLVCGPSGLDRGWRRSGSCDGVAQLTTWCFIGVGDASHIVRRGRASHMMR